MVTLLRLGWQIPRSIWQYAWEYGPTTGSVIGPTEEVLCLLLMADFPEAVLIL